VTHPPIKRHDSLKPLSRDHYVGLVQARQLIQAAERSEQLRRSILNEFLAQWQNELHPHLLDEERLLLPLVVDPDMEARLRGDHAALRSAVAKAMNVVETAATPDCDSLRKLGELLHDHIRWEERELFPLIERTASQEDMRALSTHTTKLESIRSRWTDRKKPDRLSPAK
jgi:hemerythrin-like domain-containing protein